MTSAALRRHPYENIYDKDDKDNGNKNKKRKRSESPPTKKGKGGRKTSTSRPAGKGKSQKGVISAQITQIIKPKKIDFVNFWCRGRSGEVIHKSQIFLL